MTTLRVEDMHCERCVERIDKALTRAGIAHEIDLKGRTVAVEEGREKDAAEALDELGFTAK